MSALPLRPARATKVVHDDLVRNISQKRKLTRQRYWRLVTPPEGGEILEREDGARRLICAGCVVE
eukprot:3617251-Prymnesium_polylepis.1